MRAAFDLAKKVVVHFSESHSSTRIVRAVKKWPPPPPMVPQKAPLKFGKLPPVANRKCF